MLTRYSAAATLYEMLAGRPPTSSVPSLASILYNQVARRPPPLPATVPESLRKVVMRMLRKDPAETLPGRGRARPRPRRLRARLLPAPRPPPPDRRFADHGPAVAADRCNGSRGSAAADVRSG